MGQVLGSDPDQLDSLGDALNRAGDRLIAIGGEVSSLLTYAGWEGSDAGDFRWQWQHQVTAILRATAAQSHEAARVLHVNAQEQRAASAEHGGWNGISSGPVPGRGGGPGFELPWEMIDDVMLKGGLAGFSLSLLGAAKDGVLGADLRKLVDGLPGFVKKLAIEDVPGFTTGMKGVLGKVGPLQLLSTFVDGVAYFDHSRNGREPEAFNSGVNLALDIASIGLVTAGAVVAATAGAPVVVTALGIGALAVGGAQLAFNVFTAFDEDAAWQFKEDVVAGASAAADTVAHAVGDAVDAVGGAVHGATEAAGDVADVVGGLVSGGVDAVGDFFGF